MLKIIKITAVVLFFVSMAVLSVHSLNSINQDIGRHLKSGEIIWETGQVYKTNLFSFTEPDHPFINHHWLSEVVFFLLNGLIGLKGLIIFKSVLIVAAFGLIFQSLRRRVGTIPFLLTGLPAIIVFSSRTDVRPEVFSYLFLAYFLFAIFRAKYPEPSPSHTIASGELRDKPASYGASTDYKWLYALPIIQIFWTNMHIYFALGPGLLFFFLIDRALHKNKEFPLKKYLIIFLATAAATLLNPNFIKGALAPFEILQNYPYSIVENQTIFLLQDFGIQLKDIFFFQISLAVLIVSFFVALYPHTKPAQAAELQTQRSAGYGVGVKNHRTKITFEFLAAVFFAIMAGKMIRNFGIYALAFLPVAALNFDSFPVTAAKAGSKLKIIFYSLFIIGMLFLVRSAVNNSFYRWSQSPKRFGLIIPGGSTKGVEFIKEHNISGPVFNNFNVGSLLIWKLYPEQKVFVDGRPEAYSVDFFEKIYKPMQEDPALWQKYSELYKINYVFMDRGDITDWGRKFLYYISQNPDWPLVYLDANTAIFIKRTPGNRELIKNFGLNYPS